MRFKRPRRVGQAVAVELTPLIDVVFLLLIFFMASTTFLRQAELAIELPQAGAGSVSATAAVDVRVDAAGRYAVDGIVLADGELDTLRQALTEQSGAAGELVVAADARTPHEAVVRVLDAASQSGLTNVRIATLRPAQALEGEADGGE